MLQAFGSKPIHLVLLKKSVYEPEIQQTGKLVCIKITECILFMVCKCWGNEGRSAESGGLRIEYGRIAWIFEYGGLRMKDEW